MSARAASCGTARFATVGRSPLSGWEGRSIFGASLRAVVRAFGRVTLAALLLISSVLTAFAQGGDSVASPAMNPWMTAAHQIVQPWSTICLLVAGCCLLFHDMLTPKTWGFTGNAGTVCVGLVFAANIAVGGAGWVGVLLLLLGLTAVLLEVPCLPRSWFRAGRLYSHVRRDVSIAGRTSQRAVRPERDDYSALCLWAGVSDVPSAVSGVAQRPPEDSRAADGLIGPRFSQ